MMVRHYSLYIMKHLAWSGLLVTVSLTSIIWLMQALRYIDFIVNRGLTFGDFLTLTILLIPSLLMLIVPIALFAATLFVYHKLSTDSELVVLNSAGLSRFQLALPAIIVGVAAAAFVYLISLYLLPLSMRQFKDMQMVFRDNYAALLLREEVFNMPTDGLTVFIRERTKEGNLKGVLVDDSRTPGTSVTMMASEGKLVKTEQGPRFILYHGNRQERRDGRLSLLHFDSYTVDIGFYTGERKGRDKDEDEWFVTEAFRFTDAPPQVLMRIRSQMHQRLAWPLYSLSLPLFALTVLLSGEFNRRGQGRRILGIVCVAVVVMALAFGFVSLASKHAWAVPLVYMLVTGLGAGSAYVLLRDPKTRHVPAFEPQGWAAA